MLQLTTPIVYWIIGCRK